MNKQICNLCNPMPTQGEDAICRVPSPSCSRIPFGADRSLSIATPATSPVSLINLSTVSRFLLQPRHCCPLSHCQSSFANPRKTITHTVSRICPNLALPGSVLERRGSRSVTLFTEVVAEQPRATIQHRLLHVYRLTETVLQNSTTKVQARPPS